MATTLLEGAENAPGVEQHPGHENEPDEFMHPWTREMYRRGFSFNGGERTKLFLNAGDELVDVSDVSNADSPLDGRALIAADLDDDGDVDLFVHNIQRERHHLYRNEVDPAPGTKFLSIDLVRDTGEAIGATVTVAPEGGAAPVAQVLSRGAGYASSQPGRLHFGLGDATKARVTVRWPYGQVEDFGVLAAGSRVVLSEGTGAAKKRARVGSKSLADPLPPGLKLELGSRVPTLTFEDYSGNRRSVDPVDLTANGPVTLEIWASYCRPCVEKFPTLVKRSQDGENIVVLSVDVPSDREKAKAVLDRFEAPFQSFYLALDEEANVGGFDRVVDLMRLPIPTELVLHPGGILGAVRTGKGE